MFNFTLFVEPLVAEPIFKAVVDQETPPVHRFIVFVVAFAVALVEQLWVIAVVGVQPTVSVVAAQKADTVVEIALNTAIVAVHITAVVNAGDIARTGAHVPVAVVHTGEFVTPPHTNIAVLSAAITFTSKDQFAAVVGVLTLAVKIAEYPQAKTTIVLAQEDCTVTAQVELLFITYACQATILVVGSLTVCVVVPVNSCVYVLDTVKVVVQAAVTVVVNHSIKFTTEIFPFASIN